MLMDGPDGRLVVISVSNPRYALLSTNLPDGRKLDITEDLWQTPEHRSMAAQLGEAVPAGPRFYVAKVYLPSGESVEPQDATLPEKLRLPNDTVIDDYVRYAPRDN